MQATPATITVLASALKSLRRRSSVFVVIETRCSVGTIGSAAPSLPSILAILRGGADNRSSVLSSGCVALCEPDDGGLISEGDDDGTATRTSSPICQSPGPGLCVRWILDWTPSSYSRRFLSLLALRTMAKSTHVNSWNIRARMELRVQLIIKSLDDVKADCGESQESSQRIGELGRNRSAWRKQNLH